MKPCITWLPRLQPMRPSMWEAEANQAWKDANKVIFSNLLKYDSQLVAFISAAEGTLQAKHDEIWTCIHNLTNTANIPHRICLPLALQSLDQLPAIPWDLSYNAGIPLMFATYSPKSYDFQTWSTARDGDYLLDNDTQATDLLSSKLAHMAGRAGPDNSSPIRAASPTSLAGSAMPHSPAHSPSRSCSQTPNCKTKKERSCSSSMSSTRSHGPNPSLWLLQMVKMIMMVTQHPKRATSLRKKMRWTPMAEPQMTAKAQTAVALMGKVLAVAAKFQTLMARMKTLTGKPMNPAVRLKSQMLKAAPALWNPMMKL